MIQDAGETTLQSVFVIDNDESIGCGLVMLLKVNGFAATGFVSAKALLPETVAAARDYGLIDVQMQGMDGLTLIEHLVTNGAPPPQILVMTGRMTSDVQHRAAAGAVSTILSKPLDPTEVVTAVRVALAA